MEHGREKKKLPGKIWDVLYPTAALVLCMLLSTMAVLMLAGWITGRQTTDSAVLMEMLPGLSLWVSICFYSLALLTQRKQYMLDALRFDEPERRWNAGRTAAACILAVCLGHLLSTGIETSGFAGRFPAYGRQASAAFEGQNPLLLTAATVILGPSAEEMIFRGMTYRRARGYLGPVWGALISAALFGLYHGNMVQFVYSFLMGLLFAVFCEKSGGILVPVLAHGAANLWAEVWDPLAKALPADTGTALAAVSVLEAAAAGLCLWLLLRKRSASFD